MDGSRDQHTKCNRSGRERQIPYDVTYLWNLKYDTSEFICETETHRHREGTCGCPGEGGGKEQSGSLSLADAKYYIQDG